MDWLDVLARIERGEDDQTEFKSELDLRAVGKAVCAFANSRGGIVILGVNDAQKIVGVSMAVEKVQERLTTFLQQGCSSQLFAHLGWHKDPDGVVHWIEVPPQRGFEPLQYGGRVFVRRGRSSVQPSPVEIQDLYNTFGHVLTEERVIQDAGASDVDMDAFRKFLQKQGLDIDAEPQPSDTDDLRNRHVLADLGGELHPTLYGILAFGKRPQKYPQTRNFVIDCAVYGGDDRASDVLLVSKVAGRIDEQVKGSVDWFSSLGRLELYRGLIREDRHLLPLKALRESLVNAVAHRDYTITGSKILLEVFAQHVDVTSPGGLPNHMSVESVRAGGLPRSRNEWMAHYMVEMGLMEQRGRGWPIMRKEMCQFNGTEPDIVQESDGSSVRVRFRMGSPEGS